MKANVMIVDDDPITRLDIRMMLEKEGYGIAGEAADGIEAVTLCSSQKPDIVLMDIRMPLFNGVRAAELIYEQSLCDCILMVTAYSVEEYVHEAARHGIMGYLVKPIVREMLSPAIEVALSRARDIRGLKKEIDTVKKEAADRKAIERGKGILMKNEGLSEEDAYKRLRKLAMDKRCSMAVLSEMLILNEKNA